MDKNIKSIILFGSCARKDDNKNSDVDICVILSKKISEKDVKIAIKAELNNLKKKHKGYLNIATYDTKTLDQMLKYRSLFLWHLKIEGVVLYGRNYIDKKFKNLKKFNKHLDELEYHRGLLFDLKKSYKKTDIAFNFDFSLLFTITRNVCTILCHYTGDPQFGKKQIIETVKRKYPKLPISKKDYQILSDYKILYDRHSNSTIRNNENLNIKTYIKKTEKLINYSIDLING